MLTIDILKSNPALAALTEEQLNSIVALSTNDEQQVISTKVSEIYGNLDTDILKTTGAAKGATEKTYDYMKRVLGEYKTKVDGFDTEALTKANTKIAELEKAIKDGKGTEHLNQQLKDAQDRADALQKAFDEAKTDWEGKEKQFGEKLQTMKFENAFDSTLGGFTFKEAYQDEDVRNIFVNSAKNQILEKYNTAISEETGGLVFRDKKTNEIVRNAANALNPITLEELMQNHLKPVLGDTQPKGAGTKNPGAGGANFGISDLMGAKNQVDADEIIVKHLMSQGVARGTSEFAEQQAKIRTENNIDQLPMR